MNRQRFQSKGERTIRRLSLTCFLLILLVWLGQGQTGTSYRLATSVLDESSGPASSSGISLAVSSAGQPTPIGESQSANFRAFAGYLYTLEIACSPPPVIMALALPAGKQGGAYSADIEVQPGTGTPPLHWNVLQGNLPIALTLDDVTGTIEGVPQDTGTFDFTVLVTDFCAAADTADFSITISPCTDMKGDPTGDCTINVLDVLTVANIILEWIEPAPEQIWRADCNGPPGQCDGDSKINVLDAVKIANIILLLDECP